jgi:hypothetical protein
MTIDARVANPNLALFLGRAAYPRLSWHGLRFRAFLPHFALKVWFATTVHEHARQNCDGTLGCKRVLTAVNISLEIFSTQKMK